MAWLTPKAPLSPALINFSMNKTFWGKYLTAVLRPLSREEPGGCCRSVPPHRAGHAWQEGTVCHQRPSGQLPVGEGLAGSESHQLPREQPCEGGCAPQALARAPWGTGVTIEPGRAAPAATAEPVAEGHQLQGAGCGPAVCCIQRGIMNESPFSPCSLPFLGVPAGGRAAGTAYTRPLNQSWDKPGLI